jgi:hypothetical protein
VKLAEATPVVGAGPGFRWWRTGRDYVVEWAGILTAQIDGDGVIHSVTPCGDAEPRAVEKVRQGAAAAFAHAVAGGISLHASAVALGDAATVCVGTSGAGKSTLASALCKDHGFSLLADDVAVLREGSDWCVAPSEANVWLAPSWAHSQRTKEPVHCAPARAPSSIRSIVALAFDESAAVPGVVRMRGIEAAAVILDSVIRFETTAFRMTREIDLASALVRDTRVWRVVRPNGVRANEVAMIVARLAQSEAQ